MGEEENEKEWGWGGGRKGDGRGRKKYSGRCRDSLKHTRHLHGNQSDVAPFL